MFNQAMTGMAAGTPAQPATARSAAPSRAYTTPLIGGMRSGGPGAIAGVQALPRFIESSLYAYLGAVAAIGKEGWSIRPFMVISPPDPRPVRG